MKPKRPPLPGLLSDAIARGHVTFHCADGDWDLRVESREDSEVGDALPPGSMVIAENGNGDFLFLKLSKAGKWDPRICVYWHEENRHELFAKGGERPPE